jgi:hypothetical protein
MPALLLESVFRGLQGPVKKPVIPALQITHLESISGCLHRNGKKQAQQPSGE